MIGWLLKFTFRGIAFCFILLTIYLVFPSDHVAIEHHYSNIPNRTGVIEVNERLTEAQILTEQIHGAEDFTVKDGVLYTGDAEGVIWQVDLENGNKIKFARTNGRPLGLRFDKNGNLIVADAHLGLLSIDKERRITQLCSETADGVPIRFADFLDIAEDGTVYFTDASSFPIHRLVDDAFSGVPTGRVLRYDPKEGKCHTVFDKLHFANGLIITDNGNALLVCETFAGSISKLYINGPKKSKRELFLETPGWPDNIYHGSNGLIYVALPSERNAGVESLQQYPFLKTAVMKLFKLFGGVPAKKYGHVIAVEEKTGKIVKSWEDPNGSKISTVTSAFEYNGYLYLGTYKESYIARLKI